MKIKKKMLLMLLIVSMVFASLTSVQDVRAEKTDNSDKNYNIEVVVDASGSLKKTDAEDNRYTAIDIFLQTLRESGNNVGTVVFTSEIESDTGLTEMDSKNSKNQLSNQIKEYVPGSGDTNIGLALQTAVDRLVACNNRSQNIILLLSDGNTDLGSEAANNASLDIEANAINQCVAEEIKVYGICLNSNGAANLEEFKNITTPTEGAFLEVKSSENLVAALKDFYGQIFNTKFVSSTKDIVNGTASKSIEVPSYGVEELNITIDNASKLSSVTVTKPNGVDLSPSEFGSISSLIGDYYFLKITDPEAGTWGVTVTGEDGTKITFDFVFNTEHTVGLETSSYDNSFSIGQQVDFTSGFYANGIKLTGNEYYDYYNGTLVVNFSDTDNENIQYYPMEKDGENGFKAALSYDQEGIYEVYAVLTCGEFESRSDAIVFSVGNALPKFSGGNGVVTVKITKLFKNSETIDIGQYFSDKEDTELELTILGSSYESDEIEGPEGTEITLKNLTDGKITVQAKDQNGGTVRGVLQIEVKNLGWLLLLFAVLIIVIIVLTILLKIRKAGKMFFDGYLNIYSSSQVDDSSSRSASAFSGKYSFENFGLRDHQFPEGMYFKVLEDKTVSGYGSHRLKLISPKTFYYQSPSGEQQVKELEMITGMNYDIRSTSQEDDYNDTITISLEES